MGMGTGTGTGTGTTHGYGYGYKPMGIGTGTGMRPWVMGTGTGPSMVKSSFVLFLSTTIIMVFLVFRSSPFFSLASLMRLMRSSSSCLLLQINVMSSAYLRLVIFVPPNFTPPLKPSRASLIMSSGYMLERFGDKIHPWRTPLPISNHSVSPPLVLTADCWFWYRLCINSTR